PDHGLLSPRLPPLRGRDRYPAHSPLRARLRAGRRRHHGRRPTPPRLLRADSRGSHRRRGTLRILRRGGARARASRVTAMSYGEPTAGAVSSPRDGAAASTERLSLGVAARLSRYLQVLTQAKKMGKETISSQELSDYTHVNSTQIRRDLSGFGKFGKRGVGYNVDSLVTQIRKILRTAGQHNIALFGAGHLGQA